MKKTASINNMTINEFDFLPEGIYEFITYMDEKVVGVPITIPSDNKMNCYVIPPKKRDEYFTSVASIDQNVNAGLIIPINPEVIDEHTKKR